MACDIFVFSGCIFIENAHAGYLYVSALWFSLSLETRCTVLSRPIFNLSKSVFYENIWIYVMNIQPSSFLQSGYGKHLFKCIIITVTVFCILRSRPHMVKKECSLPFIVLLIYNPTNILRAYISPKFILFV